MKRSGNGMAGYEYLQRSESQTKHSPRVDKGMMMLTRHLLLFV